MPSLTRNIPFNSPLHQSLLKKLEGRIKLAQRAQSNQHNRWQKAEDTVLCYVPESELDSARRNERESRGVPKYTTVKLPYTYALLMSQHTYLTSVFFSRNPIHQFSGRHGEGEQQVQAMEALVSYQVEVGEMLGPYYIWLYDSCKYGVGVIEEYWENEIVQFSSLQEMPDPNNPEAIVKGMMRVNMPGYNGTRINNISPWDFFPDPRVTVGNYQKGEFVFIRKNISWSDVVKRKHQGFYMNTENIEADIRDFAGSAHGTGTGSSQLERPDESLQLSEGEDEKHPAIVPVYEGCVEVIPFEWKLGDSTLPEKWMFTITGDLKTIIGVQPHGAMHCRFPYGVIETEIEGYGTWGRGLPDVAEALQNTLDWLINQHFYNVRAALNNQFIIDPSKIVLSDAGRAGPGFLWRLRPEAYGSDINSFFKQVQVQDVTQSHVGDMQTVMGIGERTFGINDQIMGALGGTNRKTATEVRTSTGFGVNRQKTISEFISATGMSQHVQRMVQLSQQYFSQERKFKIAGSLMAEMTPGEIERFISVKPDMIKGFFDLVPVDGTLPVDRLAMANLWKDLLLQMRNVPGLLMKYDLSRIFGHVAQLAGIRNLGQFKIEFGSPQALQQQADAGNLVTFPGGRGGANPAGVPTAGPSPTI